MMEYAELKTEEKELVWLPKSIASAVKELESPVKMGELINKFIEAAKRDVEANLECLEDDLIQFKAQMLNARNKFEAAKNAELEANYAVWEKFDLEKPKVSEKVKQIISELEPLKRELGQVKALMNEIDYYRVETLLKLIQQLNGSFYGETGNILKFLFDNYKRTDNA